MDGAEPFLGAPDQGVGAVDTPSQHCRDLADAEVVEVPKHERRPFDVRELAKRANHRVPIADCPVRGGRRRSDLADDQAEVSAALTILLPVVVREPVAGDRTKPCDRFGPAVEVLPVADRLQERLLSNFLGDLDVTTTASVEVAVDPLDGVVVPGTEGNRVAEGLGEAMLAVLGCDGQLHQEVHQARPPLRWAAIELRRYSVVESVVTVQRAGARLTAKARHATAMDERTQIMTFFRGRRQSRLALGTALLALATLAPIASAQDEPAFVFPCLDGGEWGAEPDQPIAFGCGWGTVGGPGRMNSFLKAHRATLIVEDEAGNTVLSIGPAEFATLWGEPGSGPSGFEDVTCAPPRGQGASWSYLLEAGLPEGTYTISLVETLRHPVNDGFHTCWFDDGTRLASPPSLFRGPFEAIGSLIVED